MFCTPDASYHGLVYADHFGAAAYLARCCSRFQRTTGAVLAPLSAFLLLQGIETVALWVERHVENARRGPNSARDRRVGWVTMGFAENTNWPRWRKIPSMACSPLIFGSTASRQASGSTDVLRLFKRLVNMGDAVARLPSGLDHPSADVGRRQRKAGVRL